MLTEYAGWQISDDKQREVEHDIVRKQLIDAARASGSRQPAWLRLQLHRLGVHLERVGGRLQVQVEQCQEAIADEPRLGASI